MKSWDCFDTLIGRYYFNPKSIFQIVAQKIGDQSFYEKRIRAEKKSKKKTYEDIYKILKVYDPKIEIDTELEYSFPIKENFNKVNDGDIVVSDMYLSPSQIEQILRYHGLNKNIKIYSSYGGKRDGWIWKNIKSIHSNIEYHIGDNMEADVTVARKYGINGIYFPGRLMTDQENFIKQYSQDLSFFIRMIRLLNPYQQNKYKWIHSNGCFENICGPNWIEEINGSINYFTTHEVSSDYIIIKRDNVYVKFTENQTLISENSNDYKFLYNGYWFNYDPLLNERNDQKLLWNDQNQYNIPALINIAKLLPKEQKFVFSNRDCFYLKHIYDSIYNKNSHILDVSRNSYYHPFNQEYINYILEYTNNSIIVDSHGSGKSCEKFFSKHGKQKGKLIHICLHNPKANKHNKIFYKYLTRCKNGEHYSCKGRSFEKFNIPYLGSLIGYENNNSLRSNSEHDKFICDVIQNCIDTCCKYLPYYPNIIPNNDLLNIILDQMKYTYTNSVVTSILK
jgi:hypothetical protein